MSIVGGRGGNGGVCGGVAYDADTERPKKGLEKKMKEHQEFKKHLAEINRQRALEQDRNRKRQRPNQSGK
jgi:hypothetical protein